MAKANRRDLRFHPTTLRVSESRVSTTMGNCFAKRMHERLNEHNDRYFAKLEQRNSLIQSKKQQSWWKRRNDHPSELLPWEVAPTFAMTVDSPCGGVEETTSLIVTTTTTTTSTTSCFSDNDFHTSSSLTPPPYSIASPQQQQQQQRRRKRRNAADAAVDGGWQVKRKGKALELRLAKHRFLQMAASSSCLSPITLDTAVDSTKPTFNPLLDSSPRRRQKEKWNEDFESSMSKGMVWVEVTRPVLVTATAMSRRAAKGGGEHDHPLLLAIGGEDGIVTVTEIMETAQDSPRRIQSDQTTTSEDDSSEDDASTCRKFGETFEISLRSRIRSLDFSPDGNFLIVGGDGCQAVLLQVILDSSKKRLQDLKLLQEIERVDRVYAVHFSPNSQNLAIGGFDGKVAVVSMSSLLAGERDPVVEISRPGLVFCVDWGPNGFIAIGGSDKNCTIVDGSYNVVHEERRPASIETLKWSNDGVHLAIADREVTILDGRTFAVKCEISNTPSTDDSTRYRITSLTWSPDGAFLAMGGSDGICLVVETKGYALVHEVRRSGSISCLAWGEQKMINGEYRRFLTLSDNSCKVTILKAGAETEGYVSESDDLSSAASSSYFSTGSDWVLREDSFRDIEDSAQDPPPYEIKPQGNITAVAFSKSSKSNMSPYLAYAADDCSLTIMTTRDWKAVFVSE